MADQPLSQHAKACTKCHRVQPMESFSPRRGGSKRHSWCRECLKSYTRAMHAEYYPRRRAKIAEWAKNNPEKRLASVRQWAARNAERERERSQGRYRENPRIIKDALAKSMSADEIAGEARAWRRSKKEAIVRATPPWADRKAIRAVYAEAVRLERETGIPHHVDHIFPLNSAYLCGLHYHLNLRAIPAEDNLRKANRLEFGPDGSAMPFV